MGERLGTAISCSIFHDLPKILVLIYLPDVVPAVFFKIDDRNSLCLESLFSSFHYLYPVIGSAAIRHQFRLFKTDLAQVSQITGVRVKVALLQGC